MEIYRALFLDPSFRQEEKWKKLAGVDEKRGGNSTEDCCW